MVAEVPALHPLQDQVVAGLERQMEVRHDPLLLGQQREQPVVDLVLAKGLHKQTIF